MPGYHIIEKVEIDKYLALISKYSEEQVECTIHTFFRLSEKQKQVYTESELRRIVMKEKPFLVGLQYNGSHVAFYHYHNKILKIIVSFETGKVNIVTFFFISELQVPKI